MNIKRRSLLKALVAVPLAVRGVKVLAEQPPTKKLPPRDPGKLAIKAHPKGKQLGWKSAQYRSWRGLRGWVPIQYEDKIGRNLKKYLQHPPQKPFGSKGLFVSVGDVVLCHMPIKLWEERQQIKKMARSMVAHQNKTIFGG